MAFEPIQTDFDMLNPPSNYQVQTPRPIIRFHCVMTVVVTAAAGTTVKALGGGIRAFLRQVIWARGGSPIQTWGTNGFIGAAGWTLSNQMRGWLQAVENIVDTPAAPASTTFTMRLGFIIPIALPPEHYSVAGQNVSAVRIKPKKNVASELWSLNFRAGDISDFLNNPGVSSVDSASVEVIAETDETLSEETPDDGILVYANPHTIPLTLSVGVNVPFDLPRDGLLLTQGQLSYSNSVLIDNLVTEIQYVFNTREILSEMSWFMQQLIASLNADSATNYPEGQNFIDWDVTHDLENAINVPAATAWQVKLSHQVATTRGDYIEQMVYVLPTAVAFKRLARG